MPGSLGNYGENSILNHLFKNASMSQPTNLFFALSTADPTESGSGLSEPSGNGYARASGNNWSVATTGAVGNLTAITWPTSTGSWGTITHYAMLDASSGGNVISYGSLSVSKTITSGDTISFPSGGMIFTLD